MKLKKFVTIALSLYVIGLLTAGVSNVFGLFESQPAQPTTQSTNQTQPVNSNTTANTPKTTSTTPKTTAKTPALTPAAKPAPTPPPSLTCGNGGPCTASQVSTHNSVTNCWVIYGSKVYNISSYVTLHPGGQSVFNSQTCGGDITNYLNGTLSSGGQQKKHSQNAYSILNSYYIADLK